MSAALENEERLPALVSPVTLVSAEVDAQIASAHRYPRSVTRFRQAIQSHATLTKEIAQSCLYAVPRAGKVIEGPSVRLAEIIMAAWGNCRVGARIVEELDNFVVAQGVFHDLETNAALTLEVQRRITDKDGRRFNQDMIAVTGRAACAIARREAIFQGIPRPLWWDSYLAAKATVMGSLQTLAQRRKEAFAAFKPFGVTEPQIYEALGVAGVNDVGLEQLAALGGFLTAIREENRDPEDIFPPAATKAKPGAPPPELAPTAKSDAKPALAKRVAKTEAAAPTETLEDRIAAYLPDAETPAQIDQLRAMFSKEIEAAPPAEVARMDAMLALAKSNFGARA